VLIGGAYYYPDAYVSVARPYCAGLTPDGCQLNWQEVPFEGGGGEWQCLEYCPRPNLPPPPKAVALVAPPPAPAGGRCELEIFADPKFTGVNAQSDVDQPRLADNGWKNEISSIQVKAGTWDFFSEDEFAGDNMRLPPGPYPELGPQFFRRLLTEMELVLSQDPRQAVDWLAQGKFAFLLFASPREVLRAKEKKLPVDILDPRHMKESAVVETAASSLLLMDRPANPNAAKVFINWLLSREGQISFQKSQGACDSARIDIPKEDVPPIHRRREGVKYFRVWDLEWMDVDEVRKFIDESVKEPQKG